MVLKVLCFAVFIIGCVSAQTFRVCMSVEARVCQNLDRDGSQAICTPVESRMDCAFRLGTGSADIAVYSEEETMFLAQIQTNDNRVVATVRDVNRNEPFAFEAVTVVRNNHTGGLEGLRDSRYCHPGLSEPDLRWSPRVLKTLERLAARTDRCPDVTTDFRTAEELEVETLNRFFSAACRPGPWSSNATLDAALKNRFPNLCSLCGDNSNCERYTLNMGVHVAGVDVTNRHINALECLRTNGTVAYVAWQHVREFFAIRNPEDASSFALLCEDGSVQPLTPELLNTPTAPCSFVRQPWRTVVASSTSASSVLANIRNWWPNGTAPVNTNSWQSTLFDAVIGGPNARVVLEEGLPTLINYTSSVRNITSIDAASSCLPARRWCTTSEQEQTKCNWVRTAAYSLGIEPFISCHQRNKVFACLRDIKENRADFIATPANYGYISRTHFNLSPVKLVQNSRNNPQAFSRVAAFVKESSAQNEITRFENLRDTKACFPEFGGIAFVSFLRAAHERKVIDRSNCDYARAVGEFFSGACAGGAVDASHAISESTFNASTLCSVCREANPMNPNATQFTCAWDPTNLFFGNRGAVACLADPDTHVAFLEMQNISAHMSSLNLNETHYRALCRNNSLALNTGVEIDYNCLLADVVDSEVLSRRNDPIVNSVNSLLDTLDEYFGYIAASGTQLINLEIYSPFDDTSDLLFKDTAIGLSEPSIDTANEAARNYIELFKHLQSCTSAAPITTDLSTRNIYSVFTILMSVLLSRFVIW